MKKNTEVESTRRRNINVPDVYNMDLVGYMADEEIASTAGRLESERNYLLSKGQDTYLWEVEICYLRREQQMRRLRSERHAEYLTAVAHNNQEEHIDVAGGVARGNVQQSMN
jgi:hypothetical protein